MSASVGGKSKHKIIILNLTSMIDICAILIIFLVMGTVIGQEDIMVPLGLKFPKSSNKEILENAPQVIIFNNEVDIKFLGKKYPMSTIQGGGSSQKSALIKDIQSYVNAIPAKLKSSGVLLNLVADGHVPYDVIFDTSKFFRESGFQSILFVAEGR